MTSACIIEVGGKALGLAIKDGRTFRFCAADASVLELDGQRYPSPTDATRAVRAHLKAVKSVTAR